MLSKECYIAVRCAYDFLYLKQREDLTDDRILALANQMLGDTNSATLSAEDLTEIKNRLKVSRYLTVKNGQWKPNIKVRRFTFAGAGIKQIYESLQGRVLHLHLPVIEKARNVTVAIEWNVDGLGAVRLDDGTIETIGLTPLAYQYGKQYDVHYGYGPGDWYMIKERHPEINIPRRLNIRDYLEDYG